MDIVNFITKYGLPVFVIATCIIAVIGFLKICKVFKKLDNRKNIAKFIYYTLDIVLSFAGVAIYYAIFKKSFGTYLISVLAQIGAVTTLYQIYENLGFRALVKIFLRWVASWFKKNPEHAFTKAAQALGLTAEKITELIAESKSTVETESTEAPVTANTDQQ